MRGSAIESPPSVDGEREPVSLEILTLPLLFEKEVRGGLSTRKGDDETGWN